MPTVPELAVIQSAYDLILWVTGRVARFPRSHRYGLGARLESRLWELLDLLVEAKVTHQKLPHLQQAATRLEQSRLLLRAAFDLQLFDAASHHATWERFDSVARQIVGWRRHAARRAAGPAPPPPTSHPAPPLSAPPPLAEPPCDPPW